LRVCHPDPRGSAMNNQPAETFGDAGTREEGCTMYWNEAALDAEGISAEDARDEPWMFDIPEDPALGTICEGCE
jgi:hypothetical protein